ncbi:MAG: hypothetical protein JXR37_06620 [Kiritimatiellae bacterium]|nr:hypothetical protein [Kiritimatiellia bacterium]
MKNRTVLLTLSLVLLGRVAAAKRAPAEPAEPVAANGVEYRAAATPERMGIIEAWDQQTQTKLWEKKIYDVPITEGLEPDVQWVFIKKLELADRELIITNEKDERYVLDLETGVVGRLGSGTLFWPLLAAALVLVLIIVSLRRPGGEPSDGPASGDAGRQTDPAEGGS